LTLPLLIKPLISAVVKDGDKKFEWNFVSKNNFFLSINFGIFSPKFERFQKLKIYNEILFLG
jgi:hypothetical protein